MSKKKISIRIGEPWSTKLQGFRGWIKRNSILINCILFILQLLPFIISFYLLFSYKEFINIFSFCFTFIILIVSIIVYSFDNLIAFKFVPQVSSYVKPSKINVSVKKN